MDKKIKILDAAWKGWSLTRGTKLWVVSLRDEFFGEEEWELASESLQEVLTLAVRYTRARQRQLA